MQKIVSNYSKIPDLVKAYRHLGKKIVLTQGSFDMIHIGHGRYCEEAKKHGDILFIGVDSDEKIKARKGPDRPVVPQEERLEMLTYLSSVDHVVLKNIEEPKWELIKLILPDTLITTQETYTKQQLEELKKICGEVVVLAAKATTSTSAKIRRVQLRMAKKMSANLTEKLLKAIQEVLDEMNKTQK